MTLRFEVLYFISVDFVSPGIDCTIFAMDHDCMRPSRCSPLYFNRTQAHWRAVRVQLPLWNHGGGLVWFDTASPGQGDRGDDRSPGTRGECPRLANKGTRSFETRGYRVLEPRTPRNSWGFQVDLISILLLIGPSPTTQNFTLGSKCSTTLTSSRLETLIQAKRLQKPFKTLDPSVPSFPAFI